MNADRAPLEQTEKHAARFSFHFEGVYDVISLQPIPPMKMRSFAFPVCIHSLILLPLQLAVAQGPLTPPGPPAPSMKTLDQIEPRTPISSVPYTITNAGSYYLTSNFFSGIFGGNGIIIKADNVSLDLNGFSLSAGPIFFGGLPGAGVNVPSPQQNISIRNGTVSGWRIAGVQASAASNSRLDHLRASGNGGAGLAIGSGGTVRSCVCSANGGGGILAGKDTLIAACSAAGNHLDGIKTLGGGLVNHCTASGNTNAGVLVGDGSSVGGCTARANGSDGISTGAGCTVANCVAAGNNAVGILLSSNCTVTACSAFDNQGGVIVGGIDCGDGCVVRDCASAGTALGVGIITGQACSVIGCTARNNNLSGIFVSGEGSTVKNCVVSENHAAGIYAVFYCTVSGCSARTNDFDGVQVSPGSLVENCACSENGLDGIGADSGCTVTGCVVARNGRDGIEVAGNCIAARNHSSDNTGDGIKAVGQANRLEDNQVFGNQGNGIGVDGANLANVIIKNKARFNISGDYGNLSGNTDYAPVATPATAVNPFSNF